MIAVEFLDEAFHLSCPRLRIEAKFYRQDVADPFDQRHRDIAPDRQRGSPQQQVGEPDGELMPDQEDDFGRRDLGRHVEPDVVVAARAERQDFVGPRAISLDEMPGTSRTDSPCC